MNAFEKLAEYVGQYARPVDVGACLTWDRRDLIYVRWDGTDTIRIKPSGEVTLRFPGIVSRDWLNTFGVKFNVAAVYHRRSAKHAAHREVAFRNGTNKLLPHGDLVLPATLNLYHENVRVDWWTTRFDLGEFPTVTEYTTNSKLVRTTNQQIRNTWARHKLTKKMLDGSPSEPQNHNWYQYKWDRKLRAKALLDMTYEGFLGVSAIYGTSDAAINSCRLEINELVGAFSPTA